MTDAHAHCCGVYRNQQSIAAHLDRNGFEKVILCAGEPESGADYPHPMLSDHFKGDKTGFGFNSFITAASRLKGLPGLIDGENMKVAALARRLPGRVLAAYCADPSDPDWAAKADRAFERHSYCMIKLHQCWHSFDIASEGFERLVAWAGGRSVPIFIHLKNAEQAFSFTQCANRHKNTVFIVAHCLGFETLANNLTSGRVYFDLSSPQLYSAETLRRAYGKYGAKRLIFGSDAPYGRDNPRVILERLERLSLSSGELEMITGGNISAILGI